MRPRVVDRADQECHDDGHADRHDRLQRVAQMPRQQERGQGNCGDRQQCDAIPAASQVGKRQQDLSQPFLGDPRMACEGVGVGVDGRERTACQEIEPDLDVPPIVGVLQEGGGKAEEHCSEDCRCSQAERQPGPPRFDRNRPGLDGCARLVHIPPGPLRCRALARYCRSVAVWRWWQWRRRSKSARSQGYYLVPLALARMTSAPFRGAGLLSPVPSCGRPASSACAKRSRARRACRAAAAGRGRSGPCPPAPCRPCA